MKVIAINKHSSKLKIWSIEIPNAPYSNRYVQLTRLKIKKISKYVQKFKRKMANRPVCNQSEECYQQRQ